MEESTVSARRTVVPVRSTVAYLSVLVVGITMATYAQYLFQYFQYRIPVVKGQPPIIWGAGLTVAVAAVLWLFAARHIQAGLWAQAFLGVLAVGWMIRMCLVYVHGDSYDYLTWLTPAILVMVWLKSPTARDARTVMGVLGWTGAVLLVWTRLSELLHLIPMPQVGRDLLKYEIHSYWLPLSGWLGPQGRWPGPLGGTAYTGVLAAFLVVLSVSLRNRSSWVFASVGAVALLLTSSRGAYVATAIGVGLALLFSAWPALRAISFRWRLVLASVVGALAIGLSLRASPNLTGRTDLIWPDFLHLWERSPITGVGEAGYANGTALTRTVTQAHSFFIDELARNGLVGFAVLLATFLLALTLGVMAAKRQCGGPLALVATTIVLGVANTPFSWLGPSLLSIFFLLTVLWAAAIIAEPAPNSTSQQSSPPA